MRKRCRCAGASETSFQDPIWGVSYTYYQYPAYTPSHNNANNTPRSDRRHILGRLSQAATGAPIEGASVQVGGGGPTTTDKAGAYQIELSDFDFSAPFTVTATNPGFRSAIQTVDLTVLESATVNFALTSLSPANANQPIITGVKSRLGQFFLEGIPVTNEYTVFTIANLYVRVWFSSRKRGVRSGATGSGPGGCRIRHDGCPMRVRTTEESSGFTKE